MDTLREEQAWQEVKRKNRFSHALRGLYVFWKTTRNLKIHLFFMAVAVVLGFYLSVSAGEWLALILSMALVLASEAFNTAIEIDINLTSPQYHEFARDTKDVAPGAVLLASVGAFIV